MEKCFVSSVRVAKCKVSVGILVIYKFPKRIQGIINLKRSIRVGTHSQNQDTQAVLETLKIHFRRRKNFKKFINYVLT